MDALPIDPLLPDIARRMAAGRAVVLEAPPGAGKTTRVPRALLDANLLASGTALVLEPRRLAARLAARRVAEELGEQPGGRVGWQVRFEEVSGPRTRVLFMTEGVLARRLVSDPKLQGVSAVLLDEFHERHLQGDVGLALTQRLRRTTRPDLRLAVMSATMDAGPVAAWLGDADQLRAEGRQFEVAMEFLDRPSQRPLADQVAAAAGRLFSRGIAGDVLVFLPGAEEIRRATEACRPVASREDLLVLPLHGDLPAEDQDRAVRRASRRKIILSTNVAESSVTIDGVVAVVDSGVARTVRHSPWSGLPALQTTPISRASARQRAGRAGRTAPGTCVRLYTEADYQGRPAFDEPEIRRTDLSQISLELHAADIDPRTLDWFEAPPATGLSAAGELLRLLGAVDGASAVTDLGRRMVRLPLHPRLARVAIEAAWRGVPREGALLAAILGERTLQSFSLERRRSTTTVDSDPLESLDLFLEAEAGGLAADVLRRVGLDGRAARAVARAAQQIERGVGQPRSVLNLAGTERALKQAILAGFPDRVAKRRAGGGGRTEFVFSGGGAGALGETSGVRNAPLIVVVDADERRSAGRGSGVIIRSASAVEPEWLIDMIPESIRESVEVEWNASLERAEAVSRLRLGAVVLEESAAANPDPEALAALLLAKAREAGPRSFGDPEALERLLARAEFAATSFPESGVLAPSPGTIDEALVQACSGKRSLEALREAGLAGSIAASLDPRAALPRLAPESIVLPGGRRVTVHYERGKPPWIESRLQDFFGLATGPAIAGRVPLVLHLLAPSQRAVQVTTDLAGFWSRHYPALRRELMRQYPRHAWPENPLTASPPVPGQRRR